MPHEFDKILISHKQPGFSRKLDGFLRSKLGLSHFGVGTPNRHTVEKILNEFVENESMVAELLAKYTKKFDKINLTPEQFRIAKDDLEKAHKEIDKKLLKTIRRAIEKCQEVSKRNLCRQLQTSGHKVHTNKTSRNLCTRCVCAITFDSDNVCSACASSKGRGNSRSIATKV